ncbi:hypothetical protein CQW23_03234 [Capsicum baccatum]|uniref:Uncharacterized protein n=1 Tax=Capsicum baccatum TaxID=33114 RepID=A0A2G2XB91_CAPBA|nr:hypothetical protein CQW23_03234 [Capsicum baccatum]
MAYAYWKEGKHNEQARYSLLNEDDFVKFFSVKREDIVGITRCPSVGRLFPISAMTDVLYVSVGLGVLTGATPRSLEKFVDLALKCVEERVNRLTMSKVMKEIQNIMKMAGENPKANFASSAATYE